jgi:hypothetical protein
LEVETMKLRLFLMLTAAPLLVSTTLEAQEFPTDDPIIKAIWQEGMENSQAYTLSQVLADSIGPRLPGSAAYDAGADWVIQKFQEWGYEGRKDEYGTWPSWERGITHVDLLEPRIRSLDAMMLAWSPGTDGPVTAEVMAVPATFTPEEAQEMLAEANGKFVLWGPAEVSCRPNEDWEEFGAPGSFERLQAQRQALQQGFRASQQEAAEAVQFGPEALEEAGAVGIITSSWPGGWGVRRVFSASTKTVPTVSMSCEDYGLVYRLAENDQSPVIRVEAEATFGEVAPAYNVLGEIRGTEKPDEYIVLSAHFDTWDGGSGATDNNSGSINMMETVRILSETYPNPKRSIIVGLWNSEEQGLNGSRAFVADHPEIAENIHAVFNQDSGTGRVVSISMQGFTGAGAYFGEWLSVIPGEITRHIDLTIPGSPGGGGSDYASFVCAGVPAFNLGSHRWSYSPYTWHTNLDTFDKLVMDDVMNNATLTAMLVYLAAEEEAMLPRDQRVLGIDPRTGQPSSWPQCREPRRSGEGYFNR